MSGKDNSPLFEHNHTDEPVFLPGNMLESARIQKNLPHLIVPEGCNMQVMYTLVKESDRVVTF